MEIDMPICKCGKDMTIKDGRAGCICGYEYEIPKRVATQADLLVENAQLIRELKRSRNSRRVYIAKGIWEQDIPVMVLKIWQPGTAGWLEFHEDK